MNEYSTLCQNFGDYVRERGCTCDTSAGHAGMHMILNARAYRDITRM